MTPEQQMKEIIRMLAPEAPDKQTDAVFLVARTLDDTRQKIAQLNKRVELLEAELETARVARFDAEQEIVRVKGEHNLEKEAIAKQKDEALDLIKQANEAGERELRRKLEKGKAR